MALRLANWKALYVPSAVVLHSFQASSVEHGPRFVEFQCRKNRLRCLLKNGSLGFLPRPPGRSFGFTGCNAMKIVSVTMVRNEADIIESFVRHHLGFVDQMIIVEHRSVDETPAILQQLKAEGAPIEIVKDSRLESNQSVVTTLQMRRAARELGADWVLLLDADEFLTSDQDSSVRPLFEKLSASEVYRVP